MSTREREYGIVGIDADGGRELRATRRATRDTRHGRAGFTILELLVVIFIMLAMTGIAVAAFRQFLDTERIKLAGGQLVSAVRMARQYAMSKRTKVMVELVNPPIIYDTKVVQQNTPDICYTDQANPETSYPGVMNLHEYTQDKKGYARFDLSEVKTHMAQGYYVTAATLYLKSGSVRYDGKKAYVKKIDDDTWAPSTVCWETSPPTTGNLDPILDMRDGQWRSVDITAHVAAELAAGDHLVSVCFLSEYYYMNTCSTKMEVTVEKDITDYSLYKVLPRHLRILPYIRMRDSTTGGFTWVVDQDVNHLRMMEMPRNVQFVLNPARSTVTQYDPGDLVDQRSSVQKIWLDLHPDGTCTAREPDTVGWTNRVNTVFLRDKVTGDLALIFVPPASSFTRQRYLFGEEVEQFIAAYSLYSLW